MTRRSRAREVALQLLFQRDHNPHIDRADLERFARERLRDAGLAAFCLGLYDGVAANLEEIDRQLTAKAANWRVARMAGVDRNVLRLGAYELRFTPQTPASVAINEGIELARRFGSADSPAFVNGILDQLHKAPVEPAVSEATPEARGEAAQ
ncbi:MAG: transcription antitermination factor NusB [Planctomycetia bacterium]|nr:transcription antitermination factor NusB [Planctomycetia bacterium]